MMEISPSAKSNLRLELSELPDSLKDAPDYLNIMKVTRLDECLAAVSRRFDVVLKDCPVKISAYALSLKTHLGATASQLMLE